MREKKKKEKSGHLLHLARKNNVEQKEKELHFEGEHRITAHILILFFLSLVHLLFRLFNEKKKPIAGDYIDQIHPSITSHSYRLYILQVIQQEKIYTLSHTRYPTYKH
jgi:hypothetical protein